MSSTRHQKWSHNDVGTGMESVLASPSFSAVHSSPHQKVVSFLEGVERPTLETSVIAATTAQPETPQQQANYFPKPKSKGKTVDEFIDNRSHHYGHFWFGGGYVPETHVVGKSFFGSDGSATESDAQQQDLTSPASTQRQRQPQKKEEAPPAGPAHFHDFANRLQSSGARAMPASSDGNSASKVFPSPFTAPRTPRGHEDPVAHPNSSPFPTRRAYSPNPSVRPAPFAEDPPSIVDPTIHFEQSLAAHDRSGVPRGYGGLDLIPAKARAAQRKIEMLQSEHQRLRKIEQQRELKESLDKQMEEKRQRKLREWEQDAIAVYGPSLKIGAEMTDRELERAKAKALQNVWRHQAAETSLRRQEENEYYKPYEENWNALSDDMDRLRRNENERQLQQRQSSWLEAWKDHQAAEGAKRKHDAEEQIRREAAMISPNILNYSDRILLAEHQKRQERERYNRELSEQMKDKILRKKREMLQEYYGV